MNFLKSIICALFIVGMPAICYGATVLTEAIVRDLIVEVEGAFKAKNPNAAYPHFADDFVNISLDSFGETTRKNRADYFEGEAEANKRSPDAMYSSELSTVTMSSNGDSGEAVVNASHSFVSDGKVVNATTTQRLRIALRNGKPQIVEVRSQILKITVDGRPF